MESSNVFDTLGNVELLSQKKLAVFASKNAPEDLIQSYDDFFYTLLDMPIALAGGWQSPLEKILFKQMDPDKQANIIHYIAKDVNRFKPTDKQQQLLDKNKLLIISPELKDNRVNASAVDKRDKLIFAQNKNILFLYIEAGGRLYRYFQDLSRLNYQLYIVDHPRNENYFFDGITRLSEDSIIELLSI